MSILDEGVNMKFRRTRKSLWSDLINLASGFALLFALTGCDLGFQLKKLQSNVTNSLTSKVHIKSVSDMGMQGYIGGFDSDSSGNPVLTGWACDTGFSSSIQVDVFLNGPAGVGQFITRAVADKPSEPAIASACQSSGTSYRFSIPAASWPAGSSIYVHGLSLNGNANLSLIGSGTFTVPTPTNGKKFGQLSGTKFGIQYSIWHCMASNSPVYDVTKALAGQQEWGPVGAVTWWGQPQLGYYCPTQNAQVLQSHAIQLRDAGIDFVFVDMTNWPYSSAHADANTIQPFKALVNAWKTIPGAPKIVPWLPMPAGANVPDVIDGILSAAPELLFYFKGKPLFLVVANSMFPADSTLLDRFARKYTIRRMWSMQTDNTTWSYMQACQGEFKSNSGYGKCNQRVAYGPDGLIEQISVTAAYMASYMSDVGSATPKFKGRTFQAQMKRIDDFENPPIVTITSWNEWIAQRFCLKSDGLFTVDCNGAVDSFPNGNKIFVDQYNADYNRDLEPSIAEGDFYYQLLKSEIKRRKVVSSPAQSAPSGIINGYIGPVQTQGSSVIISGWACSMGTSTPIDVHFYAAEAGAANPAFVSSTTANLPSESAVGAACNDPSSAPHRFTMTIPKATAHATAGKLIYVYGISPAGGANSALNMSGLMMMPDPRY